MNMQSIVNNNLLKHAAGTAIFCPQCQSIMDWKRTVLLTLRFESGKEKSYVCCSSCWKTSKAEVEQVAKNTNTTLEVIQK